MVVDGLNDRRAQTRTAFTLALVSRQAPRRPKHLRVNKPTCEGTVNIEHENIADGIYTTCLLIQVYINSSV